MVNNQFHKFIKGYHKYLNSWILVAALAGALTGFLAPQVAYLFSPLGTLFLRLLSMLIVPVVTLSLIQGILNLGDSSKLSRLGGKAIIYYLSTTALAACLGLALVNIINPGSGAALSSSLVQRSDSGPQEFSLSTFFLQMVPENVFKAAAEGNILGLIFFSLIFGVALLQGSAQSLKPVRALFDSLFQATIWIIQLVMLLAPPGIYALMAKLVAEQIGSGALSTLGLDLVIYMITVISGLLLHGAGTLVMIAWTFKVAPWQLFRAMLPALATAFSTASSTMTLPITIDSLEKRGAVSNEVAGFVAPLGATVNMDGTAIYEAIAVLFIANAYGIELSFAQQLVVLLTATFSAIGAAGVPSAGLVMMTMILNAVNLPIEGIQLIVVVDRFLDMLRTAVNVWGDSVGAAIIDATERRSANKRST